MYIEFVAMAAHLQQDVSRPFWWLAHYIVFLIFTGNKSITVMPWLCSMSSSPIPLATANLSAPVETVSEEATH